jgi:hypothetical protein
MEAQMSQLIHRAGKLWIVIFVLFMVGISAPSSWAACIDNDGDGYGNPGDASCPQGSQTDCDDDPGDDPAVCATTPSDSRCAANINPSAKEVCDGIDNNCDGVLKSQYDVDNDGDGQAWCAGDCNDNDPNVYKGAPEICDGKDSDCRGGIPLAERDVDGDGVRACDVPPDCNDYDVTISPAADEICSDGKDNNCDGTIDETATCICPDGDSDGFDLALCGGTDCNDADASINPGVTETCNDAIDNNCDGRIDCADADCAADAGCQACIAGDVDGDGYSTAGGICGPIDCDDDPSDDPTICATDPANSRCAASVNPGASEVCDGIDNNCDNFQSATDVDNDGDGQPVCGGDCNDNDPNTFRGATEICDGNDNDCLGGIPAAERDADGDGIKICDVPSDCNDYDASTFPGADEICSDGKDNNCDGTVDETATCLCPDADSDGFQLALCGGTDCNDADAAINPGAAEICNDGVDNNCDGKSDCGDASCAADAGCQACIAADADGDGFSTAGGICGPIDCDDNDPNVYPGASEICDGKDSNCDGFQTSVDVDNDNDGVAWCAGDCDDNDPARYPGNTEICTDGIDNDCNNRIDTADIASCVPTCGTSSSPKDPPHTSNLLNPDGSIHPDNAVLRCGKCHDLNDFYNAQRYQCQRCHAAVDPTCVPDPANGVWCDGELKAPGQYPDPYPYGFGSALNVVTHASSTVGNKYGTWGADCVTCHNPHAQEQNNFFGTSYGKLVKRTICFDNPVTNLSIANFVEFFSGDGLGSFADGPPYESNICETCHLQTKYHQRDGTAPGGQSHNDGQKCTNCHFHSAGFSPAGAEPEPPHNTNFYISNCGFCHEEDANGALLLSAPIPSQNCMDCHGTRKAHKSTEAVGGNPAYNYSVECVDCHNPMFPVGGNIKVIRPDVSQSVDPTSSIEFTSESGPGSFADGAPFIDNICDTCHTQTLWHRYDGSTGPHFDGENCTDCHDHDNSWVLK